MNLDHMHIALFGGSFDPPHMGHVLAAVYAHSVAQVDEVWVLPVAQHAYHKPLSPWEQRWQMCQAAFAGLSFVRVRDDELRNPQGYTVTLLESLRVAHPEHCWSLVGGTDTVRDLVNWHRGAELARMVEVIAVPRRGFDDVENALPAISSSLIRERLRQGGTVQGFLPTQVEALIRQQGWYRI